MMDVERSNEMNIACTSVDLELEVGAIDIM